jgi:cell division protein FtsL
MEISITSLRGGSIPPLASLGYLLVAYYLAFFLESLFFLTPGQIANEYSACQRLAEAGWLLVLSLVLIFQRQLGDVISSVSLKLIPFFGYLGLFFCFIYLFVPVVAWNATNRMAFADLQQSIAARQNSERELQAIGARVSAAGTVAELNAIPNLMKLVPDSVDHSDLAKVRQALNARLSDRLATLAKQSQQDLNSRQMVRQVQTFRLTGQCVLVAFGCVWIWMKTRKLNFDVDFA